MHSLTCRCPACCKAGTNLFEIHDFEVEGKEPALAEAQAFDDEAEWEMERRGVSGRTRPPQRRRPASRPFGRPQPMAAPCVCPAHGTEFVRWVQSTLNQVAGSRLRVNGVMNLASRRALEAFQRRAGLPVDGIAGPDTEQALRDARGGQGGGADSPVPPAVPVAEDGELFEFEAIDLESPASRATLRYGARGSSVADLQRRLASAGFSPGAADGIFGSHTLSAVRAFQRARGLGVDGIVGPRTWSALLNQASPSPSPAPPASSSVRWVLPGGVREAGDAQTVRYDSPPPWTGNPGNCTGTFASGAAALKAHILATFRGVSSIGGYSCRQNTANRSETSVHGTGRALDIMIPTAGGRANSAVGDPIANWLVRNASAIGVQYIIWNRVRWSGHRVPHVANYTGPNPHVDHVHVELNNDGAARRTSWFRDLEIAGEDEWELEGSGYPGISCVTPGDPYVLHCFPPFKTGLTAEHHRHLDIIADNIKRMLEKSGPGSKMRVRIVGHSAKWHRTKPDELVERAIQRAGNAGEQLMLRLDRMGIAKRVEFEPAPDGQSADKPWKKKPYSSTSGSQAAQNDRALNRRVEITLGSAEKTKPTPPVVVTPVQLDNKLRQAREWMAENGGSLLYEEPMCLANKLLQPGGDDGYVDKRRMDQFFKGDPDDLSNFVLSARRGLMVFMRARWVRGGSVESADIVNRLRELQREIVEGMNLAYFQLTGVDVYDRARKQQVRREIGGRTGRSSSLYHCKFARDHYAKSLATLP